MSDIERYLSQLRSHLTDLDPKRADEIVAEARTHLESRAAQLRATGMGEDEATGDAISAFGDPGLMAKDLVDKNARHRRPAALRSLAAIVIGCGSLVAVNTLINSPFVRWEVIAGVIMPLTNLGWGPASLLIEYVAMAPPMLLVGIIGGRRFWWLAVVCVFLAMVWGGTVRLLYSPSGIHIAWARYLASAFLWMIVAGTVFVAVAWLGARFSARTLAGRAVSLFSTLAVLGLWIAALASPQRGMGIATDVLGYPQDFGIAILIVLSATVPFLVAARRDRWLSRDVFIASISALCAIGLLLEIGLVLVFSGEGRYGPREGYRWLTIAAGTSALGLLGALIYWRRTRPNPTPGRTNPPTA